jgi:hypothetical protein
MTRWWLLATVGIAGFVLSPLTVPTPAQNPLGRCPAIAMMQNVQQNYAPATTRFNQQLALQQAHLLQQQQRQYEQMLKQQQHLKAMQAKVHHPPVHVPPPPKVHVPPPPRVQTHQVVKQTPPKVIHIQPKPITLTKTNWVAHRQVIHPQHGRGGPGKPQPPHVIQHWKQVQTKTTLHLPAMKFTLPGSRTTQIVQSKHVGQPQVKHAQTSKHAPVAHTKPHTASKPAAQAKLTVAQIPAPKRQATMAKKVQTKETKTPAKPSSRTLVSLNFNCVACHAQGNPQSRPIADHRPEPVLNKPLVKAPAPPRGEVPAPVFIARQPPMGLLLQANPQPKQMMQPLPAPVAVRPPVQPLPNFVLQIRPLSVSPPVQPLFPGAIVADAWRSPLGNSLAATLPKRVDLPKLTQKDKTSVSPPPTMDPTITADSVLFLNPLARRPERETTRDRQAASSARPADERLRIEFGDSELDRPALLPLSASLLFLHPSRSPVAEELDTDSSLTTPGPWRRSSQVATVVDTDLSRPFVPDAADSLLLIP